MLSVCRRSSIRPRTASTARLSTSEMSRGSLRSCTMPCVMRDTSSRSSMSRLSWPVCRWITSHAPGHFGGVGIVAAQGNGVADGRQRDCAARAPAWPETRPCACRWRAVPRRGRAFSMAPAAIRASCVSTAASSEVKEPVILSRSSITPMGWPPCPKSVVESAGGRDASVGQFLATRGNDGHRRRAELRLPGRGGAGHGRGVRRSGCEPLPR